MISYDFRVFPMNRVFPKQTKCSFQKFGVSGTVEVTDGLCLLPLNTMNEKIFVFLWFYLMLVSGITLILFMYRFACLFPFTRSRRIYSKVWSFNIHVGNCSLLYNNHLFQVSKYTTLLEVNAILNPASFSYSEKIGDWLVLNFITKNLDSVTNTELLREIYTMNSVIDNEAGEEIEEDPV